MVSVKVEQEVVVAFKVERKGKGERKGDVAWGVGTRGGTAAVAAITT